MMYGEMGRLSSETVRLSTRLTENTVLLAVAMQYAWMEAWVGSYSQTQAAFDAHREQKARTSRLIRRGVPAADAARGLRVL